jgi:hypothetical protein
MIHEICLRLEWFWEKDWGYFPKKKQAFMYSWVTQLSLKFPAMLSAALVLATLEVDKYTRMMKV